MKKQAKHTVIHATLQQFPDRHILLGFCFLNALLSYFWIGTEDNIERCKQEDSITFFPPKSHPVWKQSHSSFVVIMVYFEFK